MALQTKEFSVTGKSLSGQTSYTYTLRVTELSADPVGNQSVVMVQAVLRQNNPGGGFSNSRIGVSCAVDGQTLFSSMEPRSITGSEEQILYTHTQSFPHDVDGSRTLRIDGKLWTAGTAGYMPANMILPTSTMELTRLSRASTIRAVDTAIGSVCAVAIVPNHADFTHTVAYYMGGLTGYLAADGGNSTTPVQLPGGIHYWTVPDSFYTRIPNEKWGSCQLTCITYQNGVALGAQQTSFYVLASEAACAPTLSPTLTVADSKTQALTGGSNLIRYYTTLRCTPNAAARNGASLVYTAVNGQPVSDSYVDITVADTGSFTFLTRDSRGWETQKLLTMPVIPYEKPTVRFTAHRTEPGSTTVSVTAEGSFYPCNFGLQQNTLILSYAVDGRNPVEVPVTVNGDGSFSATFFAGDVDYSKASRLTVTARDLVDETDARVWIQAGEPVFRWDREQFTFHVPVEALGSVSGLYIRKGSRLQSRFDSWGEPGQYQPVLLFGAVDNRPVLGMLTVGSDGSLQWEGAELTLSAGEEGQVLLPGSLTALSPEPIRMEE